MIRILVVEDDVPISNLIKLNLNMANYECKISYDGEEAIKLIEKEDFDLILLDIMLPKIDGFTLFTKIKPKGIPVIFLTAKSSVTDKVYGLRMGADDYITKPFEGIELLARIDNVLRHYNKKNDVIKFKDLEINLKERVVKKAGKTVELTLKEFELMAFIAKNKGVALTREKLIEEVWGYDYEGDTRTIDNHIQKLRKKLGLQDNIKTIFKLGYKLED